MSVGSKVSIEKPFVRNLVAKVLITKKIDDPSSKSTLKNRIRLNLF